MADAKISDLAATTSLADTDEIEVASSGTSKKITGANLRADLVGSLSNVEVATHAATSKATPVDADEIPLVDSAASFGLKKLTWANLKATIKTYTDTLYSAVGAYAPGGTDVAVADGGTGASDAATARTNLGLAIGTNVQAYDADLTTWAGLTPSAFFQTLVDDADAATARATLLAGRTFIQWAPRQHVNALTGTWVNTTTATFPFNYDMNNSSHAQNDAVTWKLPYSLPGGTYTLGIHTTTANNSCILTIETSVNGSAWTSLTTQDLYASSGAVTQYALTGLTIPDGTLYVRFTAATKNASSTTYYMDLGALYLLRTA